MKKTVLLLFFAIAGLAAGAQRTVKQALRPEMFSLLLKDIVPDLQAKIHGLALQGKIIAYQDAALTQPYTANEFKMIGGYAETVSTQSGTDSVVITCIGPENIAGLQLLNASTLIYMVDYEKMAYFSLVQLKTYFSQDEMLIVQLVEGGTMYNTDAPTDFNYYLSSQGEGIYYQVKERFETAIRENKITLYADNTFKKVLKKDEIITHETVWIMDENNRETTTSYAGGLENIEFSVKTTLSGNKVEAEWTGLGFMLLSGYSGNYLNTTPYYAKAADALKLLDKTNADLLRRAILFMCYPPAEYNYDGY